MSESEFSASGDEAGSGSDVDAYGDDNEDDDPDDDADDDDDD